ncbi:hypothetical protein RVR_2391 [Actinacidiphila reveromycinica]|uniref:Uncharacterized protein n=1 Tax=Actinacidiphila reveromycinica TaxID=659352 RepID=A0A7U3UQN8_9ACTN|nr:hypothetical protein [Streptomyces sp. SN-593]BBA96888.1 hypothetical protein RVR_2391 [Streptomyces sp. SN-593]
MSGPEWAVPYIVMRDGEEPVPETMISIRYGRGGKPVGLCYRDEMTGDRDDRGVLWARTSQNRSLDNRLVGKPYFAKMHPARQRETMSMLRCQVCHAPASRTEHGYLFVARKPAPGTEVEGMLTGQPPVCLPHAVAAIERCSFLAEQGYVLLRSRVPRLYGVLAATYGIRDDHALAPLPTPIGPNGEDAPVPYTRRDVTPWLLASQLVRRLTDVTTVDIDRELADHTVTAGPVEARGRHA